jgi:alkanesulfonate monooxygenase SsuD/methylene tetrahydromethanopterin reductase-like flavin-dependent oxidoreductase (luciferase family)
MIVGSPETVRERLGELLENTGADELMAMANVHGYADRLRSFELLASTFHLEAAPSATRAA